MPDAPPPARRRLADIAARVIPLEQSERFPYQSIVRFGPGFPEGERPYFSAPFDWTVATRLYLLRDVVYDPGASTIYHQGVPLAECAPDDAAAARLSGVDADRLVRLDVDGWVVIGGHSQSHFYYHWLLQDVPALMYGAARAPRQPVLLCPKLRPVQQACLDLLDLAGLPRFEAELGRQYHLKRAIYSDFHLGETLFQISLASRQTFAALRRRTPRLPTPPKIYVSRAGAAHRRVLNEAALDPVLRRFGFEVVQLEALPLSMQVNLFRNARCIVAPHGGGLANLAFAPRSAALFELLGQGWINPCFDVMAKAARMAYWADVYPASGSPSGMHANMTVDLDGFTRTLEWVDAQANAAAALDALDAD